MLAAILILMRTQSDGGYDIFLAMSVQNTQVEKYHTSGQIYVR
jgi:hypothetical protein